MQPYVLIPSNGSDQTDEWIKLGLEAQMANKFPDAERHYRQALRLDPRNSIATQNLGVLFAQMNNLNEGLLTIERAAMFNSNNSIIHTNRALMCLEADRIDDALAAAKYAVDISKNEGSPEDKHGYLSSRLALAMVYATAGMPEASLPVYNEMLAVDPKHPIATCNACFIHTLMASKPGELFDQRKKWYDANKFTEQRRAHDNDRNPTRKIRVGYVGGDFKRHSAAMIFGNVVLNHTPTEIEVYFYSSLPVDGVNDILTKRFQTAADYKSPTDLGRWRDISAMADPDVDNLVRRDKIDILVDLAAHTNGGRLGVFCRKPAPIQVTAWGFAHGTGIAEIDYFLADPVVLPQEERQFYAEKIVDLPCVVTYLEPTEYNLKGVSSLPYFQNDYITFGSYARYEKLSDKCLTTFAEILRKVPDSRLEFKDHAFRRPYSIRRVQSFMPDIDTSRLLFSISTQHSDHLLAYQQADIILDPFPHSGGVVCLEQLYMGVPIVTLYGTQPASRTTSSVLTVLGKQEWIAKTPEEYIEKAVMLSENVPVLNKERKKLRQQFLGSPVIKDYVRSVEVAYKNMWKEWCNK